MQIIAPKEQINFETNKRLLNRYRFVEYECLRILAGWLPAAATWVTWANGTNGVWSTTP